MTFGQDTGDRTTHASHPAAEVVRYDRGGKWWLERADGTRAPLGLRTAAAEALTLERDGGTVHQGRAGGARFDAAVRQQRTQARSGVGWGQDS